MNRATSIMIVVLFATAVSSAQPTITVPSNTTAARSSRLLIQGSGFGALQRGGRVDIGGIVAQLPRWSDTLLAAYIPEKALTGAVNVQVFDSTGSASNAVRKATISASLAGGKKNATLNCDAVKRSICATA